MRKFNLVNDLLVGVISGGCAFGIALAAGAMTPVAVSCGVVLFILVLIWEPDID